MKAFKEVGTEKLIKFLIFSFAQLVYNLAFLPPLKIWFLVLLGAKIGRDSILMSVKFINWHYGGPGVLKIGNECFIGDETLIDLYDHVRLEDQVTIAQRVTILTPQNVGYKDHPMQKHFPKFSKSVVLKKGSVVGAGSIILPGVTVGGGSFVAAGSVVTKNIPPNTLVGGVPAKTISKIK